MEPEEYVFRRDKKFLVRLVLALLAGAAFGVFLASKLTGEQTGSCASKLFGTTTELPPASSHGHGAGN
jgi:hypothetical protein